MESARINVKSTKHEVIEEKLGSGFR